MGIINGEDWYNQNLRFLISNLGKAGGYYYQVVRGIDDREVITEFEPKSVSCENTFDRDLDDVNEILTELKHLIERLINRLALKGITGKNIFIKIKYDNFEVITRSCPLPEPTADVAILYEYAEKLFLANWDHYRKIRLLGVGVGKLESEKSEKEEQLEILI